MICFGNVHRQPVGVISRLEWGAAVGNMCNVTLHLTPWTSSCERGGPTNETANFCSKVIFHPHANVVIPSVAQIREPFSTNELVSSTEWYSCADSATHTYEDGVVRAQPTTPAQSLAKIYNPTDEMNELATKRFDPAVRHTIFCFNVLRADAALFKAEKKTLRVEPKHANWQPRQPTGKIRPTLPTSVALH